MNVNTSTTNIHTITTHDLVALHALTYSRGIVTHLTHNFIYQHFKILLFH
jgi:hypothetical protein